VRRLKARTIIETGADAVQPGLTQRLPGEGGTGMSDFSESLEIMLEHGTILYRSIFTRWEPRLEIVALADNAIVDANAAGRAYWASLDRGPRCRPRMPNNSGWHWPRMTCPFCGNNVIIWIRGEKRPWTGDKLSHVDAKHHLCKHGRNCWPVLDQPHGWVRPIRPQCPDCREAGFSREWSE
jgi:hypothetical protein